MEGHAPFTETNFDEKSGVVTCTTPWGKWWQTVSEVSVDIELDDPIPAKLVKVDVKTNQISVKVKDQLVFEGTLNNRVKSDETCWTLVDGKTIEIVLTKSLVSSKDSVWTGLLEDKYLADPFTLLNMRKKLDLEKYQMQNPGLDFSSAELSKSYD